MDKLKVNIGCGNNKIEGFINIDSQESNHPDLVLDIVKNSLPFQDDVVEEICFFHCIEHIEERFHELILGEFWRVLKPHGILIVTYPEFLRCADKYRENYGGNREFFKHAIYGRQLHPGDFHVSLMDTPFFLNKLRKCGFGDLQFREEPIHDYNTIVRALKSSTKWKSRQEVLNAEIFN